MTIKKILPVLLLTGGLSVLAQYRQPPASPAPEQPAESTNSAVPPGANPFLWSEAKPMPVGGNQTLWATNEFIPRGGNPSLWATNPPAAPATSSPPPVATAPVIPPGANPLLWSTNLIEEVQTNQPVAPTNAPPKPKRRNANRPMS